MLKKKVALFVAFVLPFAANTLAQGEISSIESDRILDRIETCAAGIALDRYLQVNAGLNIEKVHVGGEIELLGALSVAGQPFTLDVPKTYEVGWWSSGCSEGFRDGQTYNNGLGIGWSEEGVVDLSNLWDPQARALTKQADSVLKWKNAAPKGWPRRHFASLTESGKVFQEIMTPPDGSGVDNWIGSLAVQIEDHPVMREVIDGFTFDYEPSGNPTTIQRNNLVYWVQSLRNLGYEVVLSISGSPDGQDQVYDFDRMNPVVSWYELAVYKPSFRDTYNRLSGFSKKIPANKLVAVFQVGEPPKAGQPVCHPGTPYENNYILNRLIETMMCFPELRGVSAWGNRVPTAPQAKVPLLMASWTNPFGNRTDGEDHAIGMSAGPPNCRGDNPGTAYWIRAGYFGNFLHSQAHFNDGWNPTLELKLQDSNYSDLNAAANDQDVEIWRYIQGADSWPVLIHSISSSDLEGVQTYSWTDNIKLPKYPGITWCCTKNCNPN